MAVRIRNEIAAVTIMAGRKRIVAPQILLCAGFVLLALSYYHNSGLCNNTNYGGASTSTTTNKNNNKDIYHSSHPTASPRMTLDDTVSNNHQKKAYDNKPLMTIVTGFSSNHFMEGISMLQSLIDVQYTEPIYIYLLHGPSEQQEPLLLSAATAADSSSTTTTTKAQFVQLMNESPLQATIVEMEVEEYDSYCFKPRIIQDFLTLAAERGTRPPSSNGIPKVIQWTDTSIRFLDNPANGAQRMLRDGIDFASRSGDLGMGQNTHPKTFDYLNMTKADFVHRYELGAFSFLVNLERTQGMEYILRPYINCGLRECHTCMAPVGSIKKIPDKTIPWGPPLSDYLAHRQDQSVLSLLVFTSEDQKTCNVSIDDKKYFNSKTKRGHSAKTLSFHYNKKEHHRRRHLR
eukprot:scaffold483_cov83-Cylindrotheca_fusiformis.AAC.1